MANVLARDAPDEGAATDRNGEKFLGVVSGLPRVINSRFNLSASLLLLHYRRSEPHFPVSMESELLATGPASTLLSTRHLILARARFT